MRRMGWSHRFPCTPRLPAAMFLSRGFSRKDTKPHFISPPPAIPTKFSSIPNIPCSRGIDPGEAGSILSPGRGRRGGFFSYTASVSSPVPPPSPKSTIARFGVFEVDVSSGELRKQGRRIRLQDQPFAVLTVLIERAGNVVTREELRSRLWAADTFVDFDHSLNTAVNKLREVLGDSATNPRFVETLARRGYRFVAEVHWELDQTREAAPPALLRHPELDIPMPHRGLTRSLFALIQVMYLIFYLLALIHWRGVDKVTTDVMGTPWVFF